MAIQKSKRPLLLSWPGRHKIISLLAVLVVAVVGYFGYEAVALQVNKHDFQQARTAIDSVYADIVSQVGPPDNYNRYNNCDAFHGEFENGPISCDISTDFVYGVTDESQANIYLQRVQSRISNNKQFKPIGALSPSLQDNLVISTTYHDAKDSYIVHSFDCIVKYTYDTPRETNLIVRDQSKKPLQVNIGCSGLARSYFYK